MTALALPSLDLYDAWAATVRDFGDEHTHGSGVWVLPEELRRDTSRETCARFVELLRAQADVDVARREGGVHCDYFWIVDDAEPGASMVGFIAVRHTLNDFLLEEGGHIGYAVRPSRRREGHASRALVLALGRASALGIASALITCDVDNDASRRTIEAGGGVLEDVRHGKRRYWAPTAAAGRSDEPAPGPPRTACR